MKQNRNIYAYHIKGCKSCDLIDSLVLERRETDSVLEERLCQEYQWPDQTTICRECWVQSSLAADRMWHMTAAHAEDALNCLFFFTLFFFFLLRKKKKKERKKKSIKHAIQEGQVSCVHMVTVLSSEGLCWMMLGLSGSLQIFPKILEQLIFAFQNSFPGLANAYSSQRLIYIPWWINLSKAVFHLFSHKS